MKVLIQIISRYQNEVPRSEVVNLQVDNDGDPIIDLDITKAVLASKLFDDEIKEELKASTLQEVLGVECDQSDTTVAMWGEEEDYIFTVVG